MPTITIDNRPIEAAEGATILDAARASGIEIPTLCHLPGRPPQTSCYLCVVKVNGGPRLLPACATRTAEGMRVENGTPEIQSARRAAIELLLSDHLGDCVAPCQGVCPAHMDIPTMLRHIAAGREHEALVTIKQSIALPAVLGRICPELCEKGCRRGPHDGPVSVCRLKRYAADDDLASGAPWMPPCAPPTGKRVAIVGAGPAGVAAAYYLLQQGHACTLFDDHDAPGGMLRYGVSPEILPHDVLDAEIGVVRRMGAEFRMGVRVGRDLPFEDLAGGFDAVLVAVGEVKAGEGPTDLAFGPQGIKTDRQSMLTSAPGVFAAGSAIIPSHHAVRAVADGRAAAEAIGRHLGGEAAGRDQKEFSVHIGRVDAAELAPYVQVASARGRHAPAGGAGAGFTAEEARAEALRCLHCDCRKTAGCKLRRYAVEYDANPSRFRGARRPFEQDATHPAVLYEPGKCIACGICVRLAAEAGEQLGLTFIGRGFTVRTSVPFEGALAEGLREAALACADACPTGALVRRDAP